MNFVNILPFSSFFIFQSNQLESETWNYIVTA